mmetsp:Transcript_60257/g.111739  ORF Transcript_60257/g.111739 Transcript_60257/m.111739 type:complete len:269 (-) Transcript_60257:64-870(-)
MRQSRPLVACDRVTSILALGLTALVTHATAAESPLGSCGAHASEDCTMKDMGSCGNACCSMEFTTEFLPVEAASSLKSYLAKGGMDGLFRFTGESDLSAFSIGWTWISQGTHTTYKERYIDTLDFNFRPDADGSTIVRAFSISDVAGALGDMGQNHRTLKIISDDLNWKSPTIKFGCGDGVPSSLLADAREGTSLGNLTEEEPPASSHQRDTRQGNTMGTAIGVLVVLAALMMVPFAWVRTREWREGPLDEKQVQRMLSNDGYAPLIV